MVTFIVYKPITVLAFFIVLSVVEAENFNKYNIMKRSTTQGECPPGGVAKLLPHETDCSLFYICNKDQSLLVKCPEGLHFNPKDNVCYYPENAGCEKGVIRKRRENVKGGGPSGRCPAKNGKFPVLLPHTTDCRKFYICDNGVPHLKVCQTGLHFNPKIHVCDYPEHAGCKSSIIRKRRENVDGGDSGVQCPPRNSQLPYLLPNPKDCGKFYICDNGVPRLTICPSGLHFNPKIQVCDYPKSAGCKSSATVTKGPRIDKDNPCPKKNGRLPVFKPHSTDCSKFYLCDNGTPLLKMCPDDLHFNPKLQACDHSDSAGCESTDTISAEKKGKLLDDYIQSCEAYKSDGTVLLPYPFNCSLFLSCSHGNSYKQTCPSGLHFNRVRGYCDYPKQANCESMGSLMSLGEPSPLCPKMNGKDLIFYGNPIDCSVYYMCSNGKAYEFVCPDELHFNLKKKVCDYAENADCEEAIEGGLDERKRKNRELQPSLS